MKKRYLTAAVLALAVLFCALHLSAAEDYGLPSLFHNDEAWYKDSMAPLLTKDGRYHIPADMLSMFEEITVEYPAEGENLLITSSSGTYASILHSDKTAVVNGKLVTGVGIFRQNGYTYVDADWIAGIFGLISEYSAGSEKETILRLKDSTAIRSMGELKASYAANRGYPEEKTDAVPEIPDVTEPEADGAKVIYIVAGDNWENREFYPVNSLVEDSGLVCSMFFHEKSTVSKVLSYGLAGAAGVCADSVEEADAMNDTLEAMCLRRTPYVLPATANTDTDALVEAGYIVIRPDFTVDWQTDPDVVYGEMMAYLAEHESVILKLSGDGCSQRMVALLCDLTADAQRYTTAVLLLG